MTIWADEYDVETRGADVGFLVLVSNHRSGGEKYQLREHPARTNQSLEPRLTGWCGTTNDVALHAHGLARLSRVAKNGRVQLVPVAATPELMESLGYPELAR